MMKIEKLVMVSTLSLLLAAGLAPQAASASTSVPQENGAGPQGGRQDNKHQGGMQQRQFRALREGRGMGMARAAETNGYPGPKHVLELAEELALSDEQIARTNEIHNRVREQAPEMGRQIIEAEQRLEALFAEDRVTADKMSALLQEIGELRVRLRALHLNAHLDQAEVLSQEQIDQYMTLRHSGQKQRRQGRGERQPMRRHQESR